VIGTFARSTVFKFISGISLLALVVGGGIYVMTSQEPSDPSVVSVLKDVGARPLSAAEMAEETRSHALSFYWLGKREGMVMTLNHQTSGRIVLTYVDEAEKDAIIDSPKIIVATFLDEICYNACMVGEVRTALNKVLVNSRGDLVTINQDARTEMEIRSNTTNEIVRVKYASPQTVATLLQDSEGLGLFTAV